MSDVSGRAEPRGESSGWAAVNGGDASTDASPVGCSGERGPRPVRAVAGGAVSPSRGFVSSLADSEMRGLSEGVDAPAWPSQRFDRFEGGPAVGVGAAVAEAGLWMSPDLPQFFFWKSRHKTINKGLRK